MKKFEKLSRTELKNILGGGKGEKLDPPYGDGGGETDRRYKCCWDSNVDVCSSCANISGNPVCVSGASAEPCK